MYLNSWKYVFKDLNFLMNLTEIKKKWKFFKFRITIKGDFLIREKTVEVAVDS